MLQSRWRGDARKSATAKTHSVFAVEGFTLLEVVVALAIMATVIMTVLGAVNYHLSVISRERESTVLTLMARARLAEIELSGTPKKGEGTFAPSHPDVKWKTELAPAKLPGLQKLVVRVQRTGSAEEVALVRYLPK
ncbi:MAG: type II secretion system minor pseudopilin GspI [Desulfuromonadales bacterium]